MSIIISYVPAIHQGYINFFKSHPGRIYVLGRPYIHEAPRMERDIRAVDPEAILSMIESIGLEAQVLRSSADIKTILESSSKIVLPYEEVNRIFAEQHLPNASVEFVSTFLRWDRQISTTEFEVPPNRIISSDRLVQELITVAHKEAAKSADWWRQVGALLARDGKPLLIGHNKPLTAEDYTVNIFGDPRANFDYGEYIDLAKTIHAEAGLIAEAAKRGMPLDGASIYVTTFPCPVCAKLIAAAGIVRVYYDKGYSILDAEDIFAAHSIEIVLVKTTSPPPTSSRRRTVNGS